MAPRANSPSVSKTSKAETRPLGAKGATEQPSFSVRFMRGSLSVLLSPGGFFVVSCLAAPALLEMVIPIGEPLGVQYLLAWPVLLWGCVALATIAVTFSGRTVTLSRNDSMVAAWYLVNGCFFNSMMDVFAGQFQSWRTMTQRYNELEPRYATPGYAGVVVMLTSLQELLVQTPCGILLFFAFHRGKGWRLPLEIVFNCFSVVGVWYFYFSEPLLGFPLVHHPFVEKDGLPKGGEHYFRVKWPLALDHQRAWTFDTAWKFWLGFVVFPALWGVVGIVLGARAFASAAANADTLTKSKDD